jgi:hypothetical protein
VLDLVELELELLVELFLLEPQAATATDAMAATRIAVMRLVFKVNSPSLDVAGSLFARPPPGVNQL